MNQKFLTTGIHKLKTATERNIKSRIAVADEFKGIICLWDGKVEDIPSGWFLCDGENGNPDLKGNSIKDKNGKELFWIVRRR